MTGVRSWISYRSGLRETVRRSILNVSSQCIQGNCVLAFSCVSAQGLHPNSLFQVVNKKRTDTPIPTQHYLYMHLVSFIISDITQFTKELLRRPRDRR
jgi:hypothetical protein